MHGENVGGVSCFVQSIKNAFLVKQRLFYTGKTRFSCQRIASGNKANVAKILSNEIGDPLSQTKVVFSASNILSAILFS